MKRAFRCVQAGVGWSLLFVGFSGAIGLFIQILRINIGMGCIKSLEVFGLLGWDCKNALLGGLVNLILGWPRLFLTLPAIFLATVKVSFFTHDIHWLLNGVPFFIVSIPLTLVGWVGMRYWWRKQRGISIGVIALLLAEVALLAALA